MEGEQQNPSVQGEPPPTATLQTQNTMHAFVVEVGLLKPWDVLLKTKIAVPNLVTDLHLYLSGIWVGVAPKIDT